MPDPKSFVADDTPPSFEPDSSHGASGSWEPAPKQSFLTQPLGEHIPAYRKETEQLRSIAAPASSTQQAEEDVQHPIKSFARRFVAGSEADLADMLTPLFAGTAAVGELGKAPGAVGTLARVASRGAGVGFGAKGAYDVATGLGEGNTPEAWARRLSSLSQVAG